MKSILMSIQPKWCEKIFNGEKTIDSLLCWSGGKDSTASIILAKENNIKIDKIIMSEVMFDHSRNISNEDTEHINWVYNVAKPKIESWGYDVEILRDKEDYLSLFYKVVGEKAKIDRQGKITGYPIGGICHLNSRCKMRPIHKFKKANCNKNTIEYVGIAIDEPNRLQTMKERNKNAVSLLEQFNFTELDATNKCVEYGLYSPIYLRRCNTRQGCWNCPNRSIAQFAELKQKENWKWQELVKLSGTPNLYSYGFKYGKTVQQVEKEIELYLRNKELSKMQMSIFDEE